MLRRPAFRIYAEGLVSRPLVKFLVFYPNQFLTVAYNDSVIYTIYIYIYIYIIRSALRIVFLRRLERSVPITDCELLEWILSIAVLFYEEFGGSELSWQIVQSYK